MMEIKYYRKSDEWMRSLGIGVTKLHFREKDGTGHAVCDRSTGLCDVHYDSYNPHQDFLAHIWNDSPQVVWTGVAFGMLSAVFPSIFSGVKERFL